MINDLKQFGKVTENVYLKDFTTYKVGGKAKYLIKPKNVESVKLLVKYLQKENIKYFIIGNGSNLIFSDKDFDGVIIKLEELKEIGFDLITKKVYAQAGVMLPILAKESLDTGLTGFEWAFGIPGTVGGAIVSNAGAYKTDIFDLLIKVTAITPEGEVKIFLKEQIPHTYRSTLFKENKGYTILDAEFQLEAEDIKKARKMIEDRRIRRSNEQPLEYPSAGSVFRNPDEESVKDILKQHGLKGPFAGHLIEECGLKGKRIRGAEVSHKHANFIINVDNATAKDIRDLIEYTHDCVLQKYGIDLIIEQEFINWE